MDRATPRRGVLVPQLAADDPRLRMSDKFVLGLIHQAIDPDTGDAVLSFDDLTSGSKESTHAAGNAVERLVAAGYLEVVEKRARLEGRIAGSRYRVHLEPVSRRQAA